MRDYNHGAVKVGTEPTFVCTVGQAIEQCLLRNTGDVVCYVGNKSVAADGDLQGFPLEPGERLELKSYEHDSIMVWAVVGRKPVKLGRSPAENKLAKQAAEDPDSVRHAGVPGVFVTNLCKWHDFYEKASGPQRFGNDRSYRIAAEFLKDCDLVQDWGAGACWLRQYVHGRYLGIDGSGPHADVWEDFVDYRSEAQGICLRHVLEHNDDWRVILANATASMRKRMVIVLSTSLADSDIELSFDERIGVPDIALCRGELMSALSKFTYTIIEDQETFIFVSVRVAGHEKAVAAAMG